MATARPFASCFTRENRLCSAPLQHARDGEGVPPEDRFDRRPNRTRLAIVLLSAGFVQAYACLLPGASCGPAGCRRAGAGASRDAGLSRCAGPQDRRGARPPRARRGAALPIDPEAIVAEAALEHGIVSPGTEVYCRRNLHIAGHAFPCTHPANQPVFTAESALAESCNTWFAELARRFSGPQLEAALQTTHLPHASLNSADVEQRQLGGSWPPRRNGFAA